MASKMLIKLSQLRVTDLNTILRANNAQISGNKMAKIAELTNILGSDEVDTDDYDLVSPDADSEVQKQLDNMKALMESITQAVQAIAVQQQAQVTRGHERLATASMQTNERTTHSTTVPQPQISTAHSSNVKDVIGILPDFDPIKCHISSEQFISKVEQLQRVYLWTDEMVLFSVQHKLKGVAKEWLDAQPVFETWVQFVSALRLDFPSTVNAADVHREMMQRKRKPNETLTEYFYTMLSIGRRGGMDEPSINSYIINGLNQNESTKALLAMNLRTCSELFLSLENMKSAQGVHHSYNVPRSEGNAEALEKHTSGAKSKGPKCYNCNQNGHIAAKCPMPQRRQRCSKCLKVGHDEKDCKFRSSTVARVDGENSSVYPPIMRDVKIGGYKYSAFVDTGSDYTLIRSSSVPKGATRKHSIKRLEGFGGSMVESKECILTEFECGAQRLQTTIQVVPDEVLKYAVLLGRDILCRGEQQADTTGEVMAIAELEQPNFDISADISQDQRNQVSDLLKSYELCFAEDLSNIGRCKTAVMEIEVTTTKPILGKRYQVPFAQRDKLSDILGELRKYKIIQRSTSPHAASVILVPKANGEKRLCVDYRALNAVTVKRQYPMPIVEEQLSKLAGNKYFSTLDMTSGYYQIPLSNESRKFTAFMTPDGLFEYNVMPFGLVNAPMVFQEVITDIIRGLENQRSIISYVDEVIICSNTIEKGLNILNEFMQAVAKAGLTLRPSKCVFMHTQVKFLGHVVSDKGIQPGEEKTQCIEEYAQPQNETQVRRFLGITGFFRKFVPEYSLIAQPLSKLLKKNQQFGWHEEQNNAFKRLKEAITSHPVLTLYDSAKFHEVHTDASVVGIAGVLLQREEDGVKPVFYYSRLTSDAESRYSSHELEVLAITETVGRFRIYLLGSRFLVVTDCNAVATLKASTALIPRVARWWLKLQEFDFECIHRAGDQLPHVDGMSRQPVLQQAEEQLTVADKILKITPIDEDWIYTIQRQDPKICEIFEILKGKGDTTRWPQVKVEYVISSSRLYRITADGRRLVIPQSIRWRITKSNHDDAGHYGVEKTLSRMGKQFWFPRMRRYVKSYIDACPECCINKVKGGKQESQMHLQDIIPIPFRSINIDHVGPFPKSKRGNCHILVIVCAFTKYTVLVAVRNTKTAPVINALEQLFAVFGQPLRIVSDRGTSFTSKEFENFVKQHGIQHVKTAVRTPRANGQAERMNKTLLTALKCSTSNDKDWDRQLLKIQWSMNTHTNSTTKFTPNDLVFNFNPRDVSYNRIIQALVDESDVEINVEQNRQQAAVNIKAEQEKWKRRYDEKHSQPRNFNEGDLVVVDFVPVATGESHKLDPAFKGPYVVTKVLGNDRYVIEDLPDRSVTQKRYSNVVSSDHMKLWCVLTPNLDIQEDDYDYSIDDD